jgi:hypothetical protein
VIILLLFLDLFLTPHSATDNLVPVIGKETVDYLNKLLNFDTFEDVQKFHEFCSTHSSTKLKGIFLSFTTAFLAYL